MTYQHRNRRGDVYFLQAARTRTGQRRYYLGRRLIGEPVDEVPAGYEVYESSRYGQVYVCKARLTSITPVEREIMAEGIRCLSDVHHFIVDVEENCLIVHVPTMSTDEVDDMVELVARGLTTLRDSVRNSAAERGRPERGLWLRSLNGGPHAWTWTAIRFGARR